jgi:hypothetical protein
MCDPPRSYQVVTRTSRRAAPERPLLPGRLGAVEVAVPLIFAARGSKYAGAVLASLGWRALRFWIPTIAGIGSHPSLLIVSRRTRQAAAEPAAAYAAWLLLDDRDDPVEEAGEPPIPLAGEAHKGWHQQQPHECRIQENRHRKPQRELFERDETVGQE